MKKLADILREEGLSKQSEERDPKVEAFLQAGDAKGLAEYLVSRGSMGFARTFADAADWYGYWIRQYDTGTLFRQVEREAYNIYKAQQDAVFNKLSATEKKVAKLLGWALTWDRLLPDDIKSEEGRLVYQVRMSKGQPAKIDLTHPHMGAGLSRREWEKRGLTADDIIEYLDKHGAKRRGRAPKRRRDRGPIYD